MAVRSILDLAGGLFQRPKGAVMAAQAVQMALFARPDDNQLRLQAQGARRRCRVLLAVVLGMWVLAAVWALVLWRAYPTLGQEWWGLVPLLVVGSGFPLIDAGGADSCYRRYRVREANQLAVLLEPDQAELARLRRERRLLARRLQWWRWLARVLLLVVGVSFVAVIGAAVLDGPASAAAAICALAMLATYGAGERYQAGRRYLRQLLVV